MNEKTEIISDSQTVHFIRMFERMTIAKHLSDEDLIDCCRELLDSVRLDLIQDTLLNELLERFQIRCGIAETPDGYKTARTIKKLLPETDI
jgi:hypothetical protein